MSGRERRLRTHVARNDVWNERHETDVYVEGQTELGTVVPCSQQKIGILALLGAWWTISCRDRYLDFSNATFNPFISVNGSPIRNPWRWEASEYLNSEFKFHNWISTEVDS